MQRLEVSGAVRTLWGSLGFKGLKRWIPEFSNGAALFFDFFFTFCFKSVLKTETLTLTTPVIVWHALKAGTKLLYPQNRFTKWLTGNLELCTSIIQHITPDCALWKLIWFIFRLFDDAALITGIKRFEVLWKSVVNNTVFYDTRNYHLTRAVELAL